MKTEEEIIAELEQQEAERRANGKDRVLPEIHVEPGELPRMAEQGEQALFDAHCAIYRRDMMLVRPTVEEVDAADGRKTKVARLVEIAGPYLRGELCKVAHWKRYNVRQQDWTPTNPPDHVVQLILARYGDWKLHPVSGVITTPTLRPDGTLLTTEGYDQATGLYLMSPPKLSLPSSPSKEEAKDALKLLDGLFDEFPFVDKASRSVALSALLTTVARGAFPVAPMHVASSPMAGSGKSFLWDTVAVVASGQLCPVMTAGPSAEETKKRLGSALMRGQALISIDNVNGELSGDALCQCIERPRIQIRILGKSHLVDIEKRGTTVLATGNNLTLTGDVVRTTKESKPTDKVLRDALAKLKMPPPGKPSGHIARILRELSPKSGGKFDPARVQAILNEIVSTRDPSQRVLDWKGQLFPPEPSPIDILAGLYVPTMDTPPLGLSDHVYWQGDPDFTPPSSAAASINTGGVIVSALLNPDNFAPTGTVTASATT